MFKKCLINYSLILMCQFLSIQAAESDLSNLIPVNHSSQLNEIMITIQKLPEAKKLIADVQKEGAIRVIFNRDVAVCQQFGACWDPDHRVILVNMVKKSSKGEIIGSILFELQNALVNSKFLYYNDLATQGKIGKENYVQAIEYLEYQNSLRASKLAEQGIQSGIFPISARLPTYPSFKDHFFAQKTGGHTDWIAHNYYQLRS